MLDGVVLTSYGAISNSTPIYEHRCGSDYNHGHDPVLIMLYVIGKETKKGGVER